MDEILNKSTVMPMPTKGFIITNGPHLKAFISTVVETDSLKNTLAKKYSTNKRSTILLQFTISAPALTVVINQKLFFCSRDAVSAQERLVLKQYFLIPRQYF